jgi:iron(III) transport system substrate-binding protein
MPVVVFAAFEDDAALRELMGEYTEASGMRVIIRRGAAEEIVNDVIENRITPAADVLMTRSVVGVWRAAEEGALRAIVSDAVVDRAPAWLRDPDSLWTSTDSRMAVIAYDAAAVNIDNDLAYTSLAEQRFAGDLCLSSSRNLLNQLVVAMLIDELGVRDTQAIVRGWIENLALPVLDSDSDVLAAIGSGQCKLGLVSHSSLSDTSLSSHAPAGAFADVDAVGIARHARNPDGALALLDWLTARSPANVPGEMSEKNAGLFAWRQNEAVLLAERVNYD